MSTPPEPKVEPPPPLALNEWLKHHKSGCSGMTEDGPCICGRDAALVELGMIFFDRATLRSERDEARGRAEAAEAENKTTQATILTMLNINQARAQSAAQATAKIAQELQIYLKEHAPDMV